MRIVAEGTTESVGGSIRRIAVRELVVKIK